MNAIRRFGLVLLAGVLLAGTVACSDTRVRNAANVGGTWACDDGQRGLLYQVTKNNGVSRVYKYVKTQGGSNPQWDDILVAEITNVPEGFVLNALSMTPQGVMYAVLSPDSGSNNRYDLVRIDPPQSGSNTTTFTKITDFPESRNDRSVNSGTYLEIGGVPHLAMGNNTAKINSELYNLNTGKFEDWITQKTKATVKDVVWLRNPITFQGVSYNMVGINENGQNETMLFNGSGQFTSAPTVFKNTPAGWGIDTSKGFGVGGSFGAQGQGDSVFLTRNDGHLFEWSWDGRSKGEMTWQGRSNPSSDNDGASCGAKSIDPPETTTTTSEEPTTTSSTEPPTVFTPELTVAAVCNDDYTGTYTWALDNTASNVRASVQTQVESEASSETLVAAAETGDGSGPISAGQTVTVTVTQPDALASNEVSKTATLAATCVEPTTTTSTTTTSTTTTSTTTTVPPTTTTTVPPLVIGATSCSTNPTGLIQQYNVNGVVQFKKLDVTEEEYVDLDPPLSLDLTSHGFSASAKLNATAIDHSTGKIFGVITDASTSWLVQFDMAATPSVLYLGTLPGGIAATVTSDGTYVSNYGGSGLNAVTGISSLATFEDRADVPAERLGSQVYTGTAFGGAGDYTTVTLADGREAVVGYSHATNKMVVAPVDDLANPVELSLVDSASFSTAGDTLGAAWSFNGDAFFSRNDGGGLFMLASGNIDLDAETATLAATAITSTQSTNSNDGFGCAGLDDVPDTFAPAVDAETACTDYEGSYTVTVDNTVSSVDATVEIDVAGTVTSHTVPAGESKTFVATLANDATVTATATNAAFTETSVSDTATLTDCVHVVDPQIAITLECSETYEGTASYTIDNSASTLDVAVSYFIDGVETTQAVLVAGGTIGVVDIPISNGSTIEVTATADRYPPVSVSDSLTGCVAPDVFVPTVAIELTCSNGTGTYRATIDNSTSNVDATVTLTIDGEAAGDPVTVAAGETEELTGSVANGQEVIATASSTGQTAVSDSDTLDGCVQIQVFGPSLSLSTACSAEGTGSYSAAVDNTSSDMDVNVVVSIDGVDSDPVVVAAGGTEALTGTLDNDSTVTVTASAGDDTTSVSATLTDCTPPPTTTTTTVPETTTTAPPTTTPPTLPATPAEDDPTTTAPPTLPATGNQSFPSPTIWAALLLLSAGILFGKAARRRI